MKRSTFYKGLSVLCLAAYHGARGIQVVGQTMAESCQKMKKAADRKKQDQEDPVDSEESPQN